ncbi:hypothetical protein J6590_017439 [Homalodisca vitripennis]|nr:hypothetical protein J6590_017439 [Homalodisca vitripennis]
MVFSDGDFLPRIRYGACTEQILQSNKRWLTTESACVSLLPARHFEVAALRILRVRLLNWPAAGPPPLKCHSARQPEPLFGPNCSGEANKAGAQWRGGGGSHTTTITRGASWTLGGKQISSPHPLLLLSKHASRKMDMCCWPHPLVLLSCRCRERKGPGQDQHLVKDRVVNKYVGVRVNLCLISRDGEGKTLTLGSILRQMTLGSLSWAGTAQPVAHPSLFSRHTLLLL